MNKNNFLELSSLGTIKGIEKILTRFGKEYIFPQISFFAVEDGIFHPEESHFVMKNVKVSLENESIRFVNNEKNLVFIIKDVNDRKYFFGNKWGQRKVGNIDCDYIEYTLDDYYVVVFFESREI